MQVNLNSNVYLIRDLLSKLLNNARIVPIGSMAKNLMKVFEGTGTTVNAIAPGFVNGSVIEINGGYCFK